MAAVDALLLDALTHAGRALTPRRGTPRHQAVVPAWALSRCLQRRCAAQRTWVRPRRPAHDCGLDADSADSRRARRQPIPSASARLAFGPPSGRVVPLRARPAGFGRAAQLPPSPPLCGPAASRPCLGPAQLACAALLRSGRPSPSHCRSARCRRLVPMRMPGCACYQLIRQGSPLSARRPGGFRRCAKRAGPGG